jgi:hypothetical protein
MDRDRVGQDNIGAARSSAPSSQRQEDRAILPRPGSGLPERRTDSAPAAMQNTGASEAGSRVLVPESWPPRNASEKSLRLHG